MPWLVTQRDNQFGVDSLNELKQMAADGRLVPGDMVQPPGATEWLYAIEISELKGLLREPEEFGGGLSEGAKTMAMVGSGLAMVAVLMIIGPLALYLYFQIPDPETETLLGEGGLSYSEMLVTATGSALRAEPTSSATAMSSLDKDDVLVLLAKRGDYYKARTTSGQEGWIAVDQVLPMYQLGGQSARDDYDPLYNPDRYVEVGNAAWMMADDPSLKMTVFRFMMTNKAKYDMTDLKLLATVKDAKGNELERVEFPVTGIIPGASKGQHGGTFVGTLMPEKRDGEKLLLTEATFQEMAKEDPDLQLRWVDGVEVEMSTRDFALAEIDLVEIRAVPKE